MIKPITCVWKNSALVAIIMHNSSLRLPGVMWLRHQQWIDFFFLEGLSALPQVKPKSTIGKLLSPVVMNVAQHGLVHLSPSRGQMRNVRLTYVHEYCDWARLKTVFGDLRAPSFARMKDLLFSLGLSLLLFVLLWHYYHYFTTRRLT